LVKKYGVVIDVNGENDVWGMVIQDMVGQGFDMDSSDESTQTFEVDWSD
jgi:uncharacterized lipoprotein